MKLILTFLLMTLLPLSKMALAACPEYTPEAPRVIGSEVRSSVTQDGKTGIYTYSYTLKNGEDSMGCIWWFEIDITKPANTIELSQEGLVDAPKGISKGVLKHEVPIMVPVAFPTLPKIGGIRAWGAGLTVGGNAYWASDDREFRLGPSDTLGGLVMTSHGVPTIRNFRLEPKYNPPPVEDVTREMLDELTRIEENISVKGKTIGPTAPPEDFKPLTFLSQIVSMKEESKALGWMDNTGILKSLDAKLDNAKKKLESNDTKTARNILEAFLNEVEAQKDKHLTSEAYALLKFNVQYLLGRL
jgi:hypothetical protein